MTKGKHKTLSERRKEVSEELSNLSSLQQKITDLTKENETLTESIRIIKENHLKEILRLDELVNNGSSEALQKSEKKLEETLVKLDESKKEYEELHSKWSKLLDGIIDYFKYNEKVSGTVALEKIYMLGNPDDKRTIIVSEEDIKHLSNKNLSEQEVAKRVEQLQRIRGKR